MSADHIERIIREPQVLSLLIKYYRQHRRRIIYVSISVAAHQSVYRFEAPAGESFCKAVLLRVSVAPNFGAFAPELKFSASKKAMLIEHSSSVGSRNVNKLIDNKSAVGPG